MMRSLYTFFIRLYSTILNLAAPFNKQAAMLIKGRKAGAYRNNLTDADRPWWFHAASLGEFEQGRPLIEAIKKQHPEKKILLTFFSPSGFEVRKDYPLVDAVAYLPADTPRQVRHFLDFYKPAMALFIKYEYWYNFMLGLRQRHIPLYVVSAIFRPEQVFFKNYGHWFRQNLRMVEHFFCQDEPSRQLLDSIGISRHSLSGDTRFDRVIQAAAHDPEPGPAPAFASDSKLIVAGSTWPADEALLVRYLLNKPDKDLKIIIAPHHVDAENIKRLQKLLATLKPLLLSQIKEKDINAQHRVLIVDKMGSLIYLYRLAAVAYIGGGFGAGIHNTTEAAVYYKPVVFGPNYQKFREARELIQKGGGFSISGYDDLQQRFDMLLSEPESYRQAATAAGDYIAAHKGATQKILSHIMG